MMTESRKAYGAATITAIIIGLSFLFVKMTLTTATPLDALAHRFTVAFAAANLLLLLKIESINVISRDFVKVALLAVFYPILFFGFQAFGLNLASSSEAGIIQATVPIFTLVFSRFLFKETSNCSDNIY